MSRLERCPVLLAEVRDEDTWKVWCPNCVTYHLHGAAEGHRVAHCIDGPYRDTGYYVSLPGGKIVRRMRRLIPWLV